MSRPPQKKSKPPGARALELYRTMARIRAFENAAEEASIGGVSAFGAARAASGKGLSVELIDLRTIWPWDRDTVLASAAKTRRLVVAHEAVRAAGFGAEIAATVAEELGIPVKRVGGARIPVGYSRPLEDESRLDANAILQALLG